MTVCRSDRLGQDDALITVNTHLGALLHEGDTVMGYDLSSAVITDDDLKPMKVCFIHLSHYLFTGSPTS